MEITANAFIFYKNKLLLIRHVKTGVWLPVGGHVEGDETLDETVEREVKEEVNLKISFLERFSFFKTQEFAKGFKEMPRPFYIHAREHSSIGFDFLCTTDDIKDMKIQESEIDDYKWLTKKQLKKADFIWEPVKIVAMKAFEEYELVRKG